MVNFFFCRSSGGQVRRMGPSGSRVLAVLLAAFLTHPPTPTTSFSLLPHTQCHLLATPALVSSTSARSKYAAAFVPRPRARYRNPLIMHAQRRQNCIQQAH